MWWNLSNLNTYIKTVAHTKLVYLRTTVISILRLTVLIVAFVFHNNLLNPPKYCSVRVGCKIV